MKTYVRVAMASAILSVGLLLIAPPARAAFNHPGCLSRQADLDRMRTKVNAGAQPWLGSWNRLIANPRAQTAWVPNPQATVCAGANACTENFMPMARDCAAAYQCALRWQISGNTAYANKAVEIMNAWASTFQGWTGDSNYRLRAGIYGYQWACAAELMRNYSGWSAADFTAFKNMLLTKFYPVNNDFLTNHLGTCISHYWCNWDAANMCSVIAIAVLCDDQAKFDWAVNYYKTGAGNGALAQAIFTRHGAGLGQWQESGRDQGHNMLAIGLLGAFCEIAWNQGVDLYGYVGSGRKTYFDGVEYVARYNLGNTVPYTSYSTCDPVTQTVISATGRGELNRPFWDQLYNHFANRRGIAVPYAQQYAVAMRPDGGGGDYGTNSGHFDHLGFSTLTHTLDAPPAGGPPPSPWTAGDIGSAGTVGGSTYLSGTYTVRGAGSDIGTTADSFHYLRQPINGDGSITVRLATQTVGGAVNDKVGVMIRQSTANNARFAAVLLDSSSNAVRFARRTADGGSVAWTDGATGVTAPRWLRLSRAGNAFTAFVSTNGTSWTVVGSAATVTMSGSITMGIAVCSRNTDTLNTSTFTNVTAVP